MRNDAIDRITRVDSRQIAESMSALTPKDAVEIRIAKIRIDQKHPHSLLCEGDAEIVDNSRFSIAPQRARDENRPRTIRACREKDRRSEHAERL